MIFGSRKEWCLNHPYNRPMFNHVEPQLRLKHTDKCRHVVGQKAIEGAEMPRTLV